MYRPIGCELAYAAAMVDTIRGVNDEQRSLSLLLGPSVVSDRCEAECGEE
jgi:hypothetical protein